MIGETLPEAMRSQKLAAEAESCVREESFPAMHRALGDRDAQEAIRRASPNGNHCVFLQESPDACESLPARCGDMAGKPCPNDAYAKPETVRLIDAAKELGELAEEGLLVGDLIRLRMLPPIERIDAAVFHAARIMVHEQRRDDLELQARMSGLGGTEEEG